VETTTAWLTQGPLRQSGPQYDVAIELVADTVVAIELEVIMRRPKVVPRKKNDTIKIFRNDSKLA